MKNILLSFILLMSAGVLGAQITYSEDFESANPADTETFANAGWLAFANIFDAGGNYLYGYGPFGSPNSGSAFSGVGTTDLGPNSGLQYINVFSNYDDGQHANGNLVEANVFQERVISAADLGLDYTYTFDFRTGNAADVTPTGLVGTTAFVKVLDPSNNYATVHFNTVATTTSPAAWTEGEVLTATVDPAWDGMILQFGFSNTATNYAGTGVFYDNLSFVVAEPAPPVSAIPTMGQWALMILALIMTSLGVVVIGRRSIA